MHPLPRQGPAPSQSRASRALQLSPCHAEETQKPMGSGRFTGSEQLEPHPLLNTHATLKGYDS